jgi:GTP-binding protein
MQINDARFIVSNSTHLKCPPPLKPEFAFIGRSNVGKSSLINMICGRKSLAKTSVKPGKTQLINHFLINDEWYLVDLPGYGYAKVSKTERAKWQKMIDNYLQLRLNLLCTFILIDLRIPPQQIDIQIIENFGIRRLPFALVFTKADKLKPSEVETNLLDYKKALSESWEELPDMITTSANDSRGKDEILDYIEKTIPVFDLRLIQQKMP